MRPGWRLSTGCFPSVGPGGEGAPPLGRGSGVLEAEAATLCIKRGEAVRGRTGSGTDDSKCHLLAPSPSEEGTCPGGPTVLPKLPGASGTPGG